MGRHLSPRYGQVILVSGNPVLTAVNWSKHRCPICVHYQFSCKLESMRLKIVRDLVKQLTGHLNELTHEPTIWSWDTGQWLSCFDSCQLTILWMSNVKDVDLARHAWDTPPFLLIVSPTPPVQSVRSFNHVTTKGKEVDHNLWVWSSVPRYNTRDDELRDRIPPTWPYSHENCFQSIPGSTSYCMVISRTPPYWSVRVASCNFKLGC